VEIAPYSGYNHGLKALHDLLSLMNPEVPQSLSTYYHQLHVCMTREQEKHVAPLVQVPIYVSIISKGSVGVNNVYAVVSPNLFWAHV
jgi:hypothetical protein